jgi:circadian clock protein KaiC
LLDVYVGAEGVLTGSARVSQEMREKAAAIARRQDLDAHRRELERKRRNYEARMVMLQAEFEMEEEVIRQSIATAELLGEAELQTRGQMVLSRRADPAPDQKPSRANGVRTNGVRANGAQGD